MARSHSPGGHLSNIRPPCLLKRSSLPFQFREEFSPKPVGLANSVTARFEMVAHSVFCVEILLAGYTSFQMILKSS